MAIIQVNPCQPAELEDFVRVVLLSACPCNRT